MNAGGLTFSQSANTRFYVGNSQVPVGTVKIPSFSHTFGLDSNNPFFRIFAGGAGVAAESNAFITQFLFSLGGVPCGNPQQIVWGADTAYNGSPGPDLISGLTITPFLGSDTLMAHSQYGNACVVIGVNPDFNGDSPGFVSRWTALADKVVLTTSPVAGGLTTTTNYELFHGVIQQQF